MKIEDERKSLKRVTDNLTKLSSILIEIMNEYDADSAKFSADAMDDCCKRINRYREKKK